MPKPTGDNSTGWWSIRIVMPDGRRQKFSLMKHPGWSRGKKLPKKPPADVELIARKYQDMAVQVRHGVDVSAVREDGLAAFLAEYQGWHAAEHRPNSVNVLKNAVRHFLAFCKGRGVDTVQKVTVAAVEDYFRHRRKGGAARSTVRVEGGSLSPAWTRAVRGRRLSENPWKLAKLPGKPSTAEVEYWSAEELDRLVAAADGWVRDLILIGANTGGRVSAMLKLRWSDVKFDRRTVRYDLKTAPYEVPLNETALDVFQRRNAESRTDLVFPPSRKDSVRTGAVAYVAIRRAVRKAGIPEKGSYNHILRHTFASHAVMRGLALSTVSKWLGHTNISMTMRYAHLCPADSARQMENFNLGRDPASHPGVEAESTPPPPSGRTGTSSEPP